MNNICKKIWNNSILDSEIIQDIEYKKSNDPRFDINLGCDERGWSLLTHAVYYGREDLNLIIQHCIIVKTFLFLNYFSITGTLMLIYKINIGRQDYIGYVMGDVKHV